MNIDKLKLYILLSLISPAIAFCDEGYSSAEPSSAANIYSRTFTIYTHKDACDKSPVVSEIRIKYPKEIIEVGNRIHANSPDDSIVSDFIIKAFNAEGNFLPSVPIYVDVNLQDSTLDFDPGIIYRDATMNYWEARKPGMFVIRARWACPSYAQSDIQDTITIEVVERNE